MTPPPDRRSPRRRRQIVLVLADGQEFNLRDDREKRWKRLSIEGQIQALTLGGNHHQFVVLELADGGVVEMTIDTARTAQVQTREPLDEQ